MRLSKINSKDISGRRAFLKRMGLTMFAATALAPRGYAKDLMSFDSSVRNVYELADFFLKRDFKGDHVFLSNKSPLWRKKS